MSSGRYTTQKLFREPYGDPTRDGARGLTTVAAEDGFGWLGLILTDV